MYNLKKLALLALSIISVISAQAQDYDKITASLNENNTIGIPVVKDFDKDFVTSLDKRGEPIIYTRENSSNFEYIGMPISGIATGQLYMGGDGQLWFWDIFNHTKSMGDYKGEEVYQYPYKRSAGEIKGVNNVDQGFAIEIDGKRWNLNRSGFKDIAFRGEYPVAKVHYADKGCAVEVDLEAYSPFVPLELESSAYPATIMSYTVTNPSDKSVELKMAGWLENCAQLKSRKLVNGYTLCNKRFEQDDAVAIGFSAVNDSVDMSKFYDYGDMALAVLDKSAQSNVACQNYPFDPFLTSGELSSESKLKKSIGTLVSSLTLAPGESKTLTYVMSWYYPNTGVSGGGRREYVNRFDNAEGVAREVLANYDYLSSTTKQWNQVWYDSTLPYWFLDRTFVNTSILATQTCFLFEDGRFYGFEGGLQGEGTCTHVWGYEHAMLRLFPELEQNLREKTDFTPLSEGGGFNPETGEIFFRGKYNNKAAVDGHSSIIVRSYLIHKMGTDDKFLRANYDDIKLAMEYLINNNDADNDGILTGAQHNTLDSDWTGKVAWLSGYYQTALLCAAKMSDEMGDVKFARRCRAIAKSGRKLLERDLFNGEYFFQLPAPEGERTVGIQNGCEYSQMLGQSQAYQAGLGEVVDPVKITSALNALWKYNFTTDVGPYRKERPAGRWYAMPSEGGLIACTWPNGGSEALENDFPRFAAYNNECQNGYEYAATSLMMWHDEPYRALAHTWIMENVRHNGAVRNPYCEIEWGLHYARSMASYGLFTAACGFDYDGPKGYLRFDPKIQQRDFKAPLVTAKGWGSYSQKASDSGAEYVLSIAHGELQLNQLEIPALVKGTRLKCTIGGNEVKVRTKRSGDNLLLTFDSVELKAGEKLLIESL